MPGPVVAAACELSLLYGEHTWGGAIGWIHGPLSFGEEFQKDRAAGRFARIESSWDEHTAYINKARELIAPVLAQNVQVLASSLNISGERVVVYNPLPWKRSGFVRISGSGLSVNALKAADNAETIPVERDGSDLLFLALDIPPMGYRTYVPAPAAASEPARRPESAGQSIIETPFFKAVLDPSRGVVASLVDKRSGRELVGNSEKPGSANTCTSVSTATR